MNTLLWFCAMFASLILVYMAWVDHTGTTWTLVGWLGIGLAFFSLAATIGALVDEVNAYRGREG